MARPLLCAVAIIAMTLVLPARLAGLGAGRWFDDDLARADALADGVETWLSTDLDRAGFSTGSPLFDGEWLFASYQMAGIGFGQLALAHPEHRERHVAAMELAIDRMLADEVLAFDAERWGADPLEDLDDDDAHHVAFLGYAGIVLGLHRTLVPDSRYGELLDAIAGALTRRYAGSSLGLLETYPGEVYPIDNTAALATLALHADATGIPRPVELERALAALRARWIDSDTGLMVQAIDPRSGDPRDRARGSGTALAAMFLSFADPALARELATTMRDELAGGVLGFGLVREYPRGTPGGPGDVDSGPVLLGYGVSATGFSLASARLLDDRAWGVRLMRTAQLFGAPYARGVGESFATGGPLGDAILLAMLTTAPLGAAP
jgi:hypothetical protein